MNRKEDKNWIPLIEKGDSIFAAIAYNPKVSEEYGFVDVDGSIEKNVVYLAEIVDGKSQYYQQYDVVDVSVDQRREKTTKAVILGIIDEGFLELARNFDVIDKFTLDKFRYHGEFIVTNKSADKRREADEQGRGQGQGMKSFDGKDISDFDVDTEDIQDFIDDDSDNQGQKGQGQKSGDQKDDKSKGQKDKDGQGQGSQGQDDRDSKDDKKSKGQGGQGQGEQTPNGDDDKGQGGSGAHGNGDIPKPDDTPSRTRRVVTKVKFF